MNMTAASGFINLSSSSSSIVEILNATVMELESLAMGLRTANLQRCLKLVVCPSLGVAGEVTPLSRSPDRLPFSHP